MFLSHTQTNFSDECQETSSGSGIFIEKANDYGFFTEPNLEENFISNDFRVKPVSVKKNKGFMAKVQGFKKEKKGNHCNKETNQKNKGLDTFLESFNLVPNVDCEVNHEIEKESFNKEEKALPPSLELMQSIEKIIDSHFECPKEYENLLNFSKPLIEIIEEEQERKINFIIEEVPPEIMNPHRNYNILNLIPIKVNKKIEEEEDKSETLDEEIASICDDLQKTDNTFSLKPRNSKPTLNYFIIDDENNNEIFEVKQKIKRIELKKKNEFIEKRLYSNKTTAKLLSACFGKKPLFDEINERLFENQEILETKILSEKKKIPKVYQSKSIIIDDNLIIGERSIPLINDEINTKPFINVFEKEKDMRENIAENTIYSPKGDETIFKNIESHKMTIEPPLLNPVTFERKKKIIEDKINHLIDLNNNIQKDSKNKDDSISFSNKSNEQISNKMSAESQQDNIHMDNHQHSFNFEDNEEIDFNKLEISDKTIEQRKNKNKKKLIQKQSIYLIFFQQI